MIKEYCKQNLFNRSDLVPRKLAFNLSEVLVVVGIVGMVSDLLMPGLIENYRKEVAIVQLNRSYAVATSAYTSAVSENGTPDTWGLSDSGDPAGLESLNSIMSNSLKVAKNCGTDKGCFAEAGYKNIAGTSTDASLDASTDNTKFLLPDGSSMSLSQLDSNCDLKWGSTQALSNVCGTIGVDVNGLKGPNTYGEDYFGFILTKYGVVPMGTPAQTVYPFDGYCEKNNVNSKNGLSCSAWALYNANMDYKNCVGLSWSGSATCEAVRNQNQIQNKNLNQDGICIGGKNDTNNDNNGVDNKNFKNGNLNTGNNGNNNCNGNY